MRTQCNQYLKCIWCSVAALGVALGGCSGDSTLLDAVSEQQDAVLGGVLDSGHPTVGSLESHQGGYAIAGLIVGGQSVGLCSATVVGKRTVLTAAHCVLADDGTVHKHFYFYVGGNRYYAGQAVAAEYDNAKYESHDVAVVKLSRDVTGISPLPLSSVAPILGEELLLVGYGREKKTGAFGTKRKANGVVSSMVKTVVNYATPAGNGMSCPGDSGGPVFARRGGQEVQIAINTNGDCALHSYGMRIDAFLSWIETQAAGDLTTSAVAPVDTVAPSVKILSPQAGAVLGQSFVMDIDAHDNVGVAKAVLSRDGKVLTTAGATQGGYRFTLSSVPEGAHVYQMTVYDQAGLSSSDSVQVTVKAGAGPLTGDTIPPQVKILEPSLGATLGASFTAKVEATDNVGVSKVVLYVDGVSLGSRAQAPYVFLVSDAVEGEHRVKAIAYDAAGNSGMFETKVFVEPPPIPVPKPTPPVVRFIQPSAGAVVEQSFTAQVEATDADSIREVVLYLDDAQVGSKAAPPYTFALAGVTPGSRVLRAVATDGSGDVAATSIAIGVRYSGQPIKDPGAYGAPCASASECATHLCALDPGTGERRCTVGCDLQNDACPAGSYCDTSVESAGETVCRSALVDAGADSVDGGGCATAASGGRLSAPWVLLVIALFWGLTPLVAGAFQEETGEQTER